MCDALPQSQSMSGDVQINQLMINNCIQCNNVSASGSCGSRGFSSLPSSNSYVHNFMYTACVCVCVGGGGVAVTGWR